MLQFSLYLQTKWVFYLKFCALLLINLSKIFYHFSSHLFFTSPFNISDLFIDALLASVLKVFYFLKRF